MFFFIRRLTFSFESFGLLNDVFPFYTILDTSCPIFDEGYSLCTAFIIHVKTGTCFGHIRTAIIRLDIIS